MGPLDLLKFPLFFVFGVAVSVLITPTLIRFAPILGFIDTPDARRVHKAPIPRWGGVAIFFAFHIGMALLFFSPYTSARGAITSTWWQTYFFASATLLLIGLCDDRFGLPWFLKLLGQIAVASWLFMAGIGFHTVAGMELSSTLSFILTVGWLVGIMNAFNLIDGMDGLATGLAVVAAAGVAGVTILARAPFDTTVLLLFCGACVGFLIYNFHPARIFLGDSGSMFLGLTLGCIALTTGTKNTLLAAVGVPLLAMGVPVFDTILAIWRRSVRAFLNREEGGMKQMMHADMDHLHHRLMSSGLNQRRVAVLLYAVNALLVSVGLLTLIFESQALGIFLIAFVLGTYVVVRHFARIELWDSGSIFLRGIHRPSSPVLATTLYPVVDCISLICAALIPLILVGAYADLQAFKEVAFSRLPVLVGVPFIALVFAGTYNRVWSRSRLTDFVMLSCALIAGSLVALGIQFIWAASEVRFELTISVMQLSLAVVLCCGIRAFPRLIQDILTEIHRNDLKTRTDIKRVLIYGAEHNCALYLRQRALFSSEKPDTRIVIGLIDDERNLRKRMVYGYTVLGEFSELLSLVKEHRIDEIIVVTKLSSDQELQLAVLEMQVGVVSKVWTIEEHFLSSRTDARRVVGGER
jgi:UDP-GlcNAc:undecaprenyl-phosphate GlcNAc-1-phosphate transferase